MDPKILFECVCSLSTVQQGFQTIQDKPSDIPTPQNLCENYLQHNRVPSMFV